MDQFSTAAWDDLLNDRLILRRRRNRDVQTEVCRRVVKLKAENGCDQFPTDVYALARAVGIREIRSAPLTMRGRIVRENIGIVAELNEGLSPRAKRFVLAHEIAHILLARDLANTGPTEVFGSTGSKRGYAYVERLCDFAAREILVPENAILKELKSQALSLDLAATIAREADCDLEVLAECICNLPGHWRDLLFLFCRISTGDSKVVRAVPDSATTFELADGEDTLVRRAVREKKAINGTQELWAGSNVREVAAEALSIDSDNVVLLIDSSSI